MGCCNCMSKVFLIIFNIVFFLVGLVPLVFGSIALANPDLLKSLLDSLPGFDQLNTIVNVEEFFQNFAIAFIVLGSVIVLIGFAGCCGAIFNSKILLGVYLSVILLVIIGEVTVIIIAVFFPDTFSAGGEALMKANFKDIQDCNFAKPGGDPCDSSSALSAAWNAMQFELDCCGYSGLSDYENTKGDLWVTSRTNALAPASCCKGSYGSLTDPQVNEEFARCYLTGTNASQYNQEGCFDVLFEEAISSVIFIAIMSGIGAVEIILVIATITALCKKSKGKAT